MIKNLTQFIEHFKDEQTCLEYFENIRFRNEKHCIFCKHTTIYSLKTRKVYKCPKCEKQFSIKVGTIFEGSKIKLRTWFICMYLISVSKKGISSVQLSEQIGTTQKTAWFMLHRLREIAGENIQFFDDIVEIDETYIGGKENNKHKSKKTKNTQGRSLKTKTAVIGIKSRKTGKIQARKADNVKSTVVKSIMDRHVSANSIIYTDEFRNYNFIPKHRHGIVNHRSKEYVNGDIHTNGIENFWSIFKRGYIGVYHFMSAKHLQKYINEFTFRFNNKNENFVSLILEKSIGKRMTYNKLIKGKL